MSTFPDYVRYVEKMMSTSVFENTRQGHKILPTTCQKRNTRNWVEPLRTPPTRPQLWCTVILKHVLLQMYTLQQCYVIRPRSKPKTSLITPIRVKCWNKRSFDKLLVSMVGGPRGGALHSNACTCTCKNRTLTYEDRIEWGCAYSMNNSWRMRPLKVVIKVSPRSLRTEQGVGRALHSRYYHAIYKDGVLSYVSYEDRVKWECVFPMHCTSSFPLVTNAKLERVVFGTRRVVSGEPCSTKHQTSENKKLENWSSSIFIF